MKSITKQLVITAIIADMLLGTATLAFGILTTFTNPGLGWTIIPVALLLWFNAWAIFQADYSELK